MNLDSLYQFTDQGYLNLESYRRNGTTIRTPIRFIEDHCKLYVYSLAAETSQVRHINRYPYVRVMPCSLRGKPKGQWVEAEAHIADLNTLPGGHELFLQKYGWPMKIQFIMNRVLKRQRVAVAIELL